MNLLKNGTADYIITGSWSKSAYDEALKYGKTNIVTNSKSNGFISIEEFEKWNNTKDSSYTYFCDNETINGIEFNFIPKSESPLVSDMSSNFLSKKLDISKYGMIYACAQKNFGVAGLVIVIIKKDLLGNEQKITPTCLNYKKMAESNSLYNTPMTYGIYVANLMFEWIKEQGGIEEIEKRNQKKAILLYDFIDSSSFYYNPVKKEFRSRMNVICKIRNGEDLEKKFIKESESFGIIGVGGHRSVGGLRFSIYNAVTIDSVEILIGFMKKFEKENQ